MAKNQTLFTLSIQEMDLVNASSDGDIKSLNSALDAKVPVDIVTHVRCLITLFLLFD